MSDFRREVGTGFDVACRWIAIGLDWAFYIIFLPITYPLALLGRRERERIRQANEASIAKYKQAPIEVPKKSMSIEEILAHARKKR